MTNGKTRQVKFTVKDRTLFDMEQVKQALGSRYADGARVMTGPTTQ